MHGRTDDGQKVITIAHPEHSADELKKSIFELHHGKRVVTAYANSKSSGEPAHPHRLARTYAVG